MLSVKFDDIEMSDYITVLHGFTTFDGADFQPELKEIDGGNGSKFLYTRHGYKTIPMPFFVKKNLNDKYDVLEKILSVKEPKPLIFGNMPDRCFYAVPSSTLSFDEIIDFGKGNITWLVPDGLAHSTTETPFTATLNSDGVLEATIVNDGTAEVPISYEIKHKSDNGYVGIVSEYGVMEFGSREELDGEDYQANDILKVSNRFGDWTDDKGLNAQNININTNGTLSEKDFPFDSVFGKNGLYLSDAGTGDYWHGGMKSVVLPADTQGEVGCKNIYVYFNHVFVAGLQSQTGIFMLNLIDEEDEIVCSYYVYKASPTSGSASANMWIAGTNGGVWKSFEFVPFPDAARNQFSAEAGHCSIQKMGDYFTFYWRNQDIGGVHVPELADKKIVKAQYFIGQYGDRTIFAKDYMSYNYLRNISFTKVNVDKWRDVPNRYSNELLLRIDGEEKKPYTNGMLALDDEIVGTQYFLAPPGETKVKFYVSSFAEPPEIKAIIRKAWL